MWVLGTMKRGEEEGEEKLEEAALTRGANMNPVCIAGCLRQRTFLGLGRT